jgi:hypothetical protein
MVPGAAPAFPRTDRNRVLMGEVRISPAFLIADGVFKLPSGVGGTGKA